MRAALAAVALLALAGCGREAAAPKAAEPAQPQDPPAAAGTPQAKPSGELRSELDACLDSGEAAQGVTTAMAACLGAEYERQDARLNRAYQAAMARQDEAQKGQLRQAQRAWIRYRDESCREGATGGTIDRLNGPSCMIERTKQRAGELEALASPEP